MVYLDKSPNLLTQYNVQYFTGKQTNTATRTKAFLRNRVYAIVTVNSLKIMKLF